MEPIYPQVAGEFDTLYRLIAGASLARFGDGEFKLIDGKEYLREPASEKLGAELLEVLRGGTSPLTPHASPLLVGIPTMDPAGPKYENWLRHRARFARIIYREGLGVKGEGFPESPHASRLTPHVFYSAFITRPDSAPWINCVEFAQKMESLWKGKRAAVLAESGNSLLKVVRLSAKKLKHIECPHREAYAEIDALERALVRAKPEIALLSCGPTATCLANRLAARGIQAVDMGSAGGYLLRLLTAKNVGA